MTAKQRLIAFIARYMPEVQRVARQSLARMRRYFPGAIELVYDNYNALVIGFGPSEHASEAICSIVLYPRYVTLFFLAGATLPDPHEVLKGSGKIVRRIDIHDAAELDQPAIRTLIQVAIKQSGTRFKAGSRGRTVIRAIVAKQRPRRPR